MARPGRRPLPTLLKAQKGTLRVDRQNGDEPQPKAEVPRCPEHLQGDAKKEWRRMSRDLVKMGLLARIDRGALALYCQAWGRWVDAEQALVKYGVIVKSPNGFPVQSPYLSIANKAMAQMRMLLTEFGMSPSSRARVHAEPQPREDPFETLLEAGRSAN